jgi:glucose-1-phosphatase
MAEMQIYRAVVWDMGGVILKTENSLPRTQLAERLGVTRAELEKLVFSSETARLAEVGKVLEDDVWEFVRLHFGLQPAERLKLEEDFWGGDRFDLDLIDFIQSLKPAYKTGLLSNAWSGARESVNRRFPFLHIFDETIFSAEVRLAKPDARIYSLMVNRLGIQPNQAIFVDDIKGNVMGAEAIGMRGIRYESTAQVKEELGTLLFRAQA